MSPEFISRKISSALGKSHAISNFASLSPRHRQDHHWPSFSCQAKRYRRRAFQAFRAHTGSFRLMRRRRQNSLRSDSPSQQQCSSFIGLDTATTAPFPAPSDGILRYRIVFHHIGQCQERGTAFLHTPILPPESRLEGHEGHTGRGVSRDTTPVKGQRSFLVLGR